MMETEKIENKTVLELQYQYFLNYLNIITVTIISLLLTIWLSKEIIVTTISYKIIITTAGLFLWILFLLILQDRLNDIERRIKKHDIVIFS